MTEDVDLELVADAVLASVERRVGARGPRRLTVVYNPQIRSDFGRVVGPRTVEIGPAALRRLSTFVRAAAHEVAHVLDPGLPEYACEEIARDVAEDLLAADD